MGALSAEARGIVRDRIRRLRTAMDKPVFDYAYAQLEKASTRIASGKRISEAEFRKAKSLISTLPLPHSCLDNRTIYAQPADLVYSEDVVQYEETNLVVRLCAFEGNRRWIGFLDSDLGLSLSFHCLGRLYERWEHDPDRLFERVFEQATEILGLMLVFIRAGARGEIAIPFESGLLIGSIVRLPAGALCKAFSAEKNWENSGEAVRSSPLTVGAAGSLGFRASTYVSGDQLRPDQQAYLERVATLAREHSDLIIKLVFWAMAAEYEIPADEMDAELEVTYNAFRGLHSVRQAQLPTLIDRPTLTRHTVAAAAWTPVPLRSECDDLKSLLLPSEKSALPGLTSRFGR
jgi:hypothetical protein